MVVANLCNLQFFANIFDRSTSDIMSIIVCNCQHCAEQQFQILSCVQYTIFSVVKLNLFIRALAVTGSDSCPGKHYAYASRTSCSYIIFTTFCIQEMVTKNKNYDRHNFLNFLFFLKKLRIMR